jgi:ferredoxin
MEISNIKLVYFSATYTTKNILKLVADQMNGEKTEYDITQTALENEIFCTEKDVLIIGAPVYAGRIPEKARQEFEKIKGNNTPAVIFCVYGNRDYDDALLEIKDLVESNGFKVISAGAFIAQHSIFPQVGLQRPDETDISIIREFGKKSAEIIANTSELSSLPSIEVKGNKPYKFPGNIPLKPEGNKNCDQCGRCVKLCPVHAIPKEAPRKTDKNKCISCGRCIVICHTNARHFGGLLYKVASKKFVQANSQRKEPELHYTIQSL